MSTLEQRAAAAKAEMVKQNPSVAPGKPVAERKRVPLSIPQRKLEVPEIPGFHLRWIEGTAQRLAQAERAGFVFVEPHEVELNEVSIGGDATKSGNSDMGSRVSVVAGGISDDSQALRLYLMKQRMEDYLEDQKLLDDRNGSIADALTRAYRTGTVGGRDQGETADDAAHRYVDPKRSRVPELFKRKAPRR